MSGIFVFHLMLSTARHLVWSMGSQWLEIITRFASESLIFKKDMVRWNVKNFSIELAKSTVCANFWGYSCPAFAFREKYRNARLSRSGWESRVSFITNLWWAFERESSTHSQVRLFRNWRSYVSIRWVIVSSIYHVCWGGSNYAIYMCDNIDLNNDLVDVYTHQRYNHLHLHEQVAVRTYKWYNHRHLRSGEIFRCRYQLCCCFC